MSRHSIKKLHSDFTWLLSLLVWALFFVSFYLLADEQSFVADTFVNFRVQYLLAALLAGTVCLKSRCWLMFGMSTAVAIVNSLVLLPYIPASPPTVTGPQLKVMVSNALTKNDKHKEFLETVAAENPDLLAIVEFDENWEHSLEKLSSGYPHRVLVPRPDNFGLALYSKLPLSGISDAPFETGQAPSIEATFELDGKPATIIVSHPPPPSRPVGFESRNLQLESLAERVQAAARPVIVAGDLNSTPWSFYLKRLLQNSGLKNSRHGIGVLPTWPTMMPPMYIPIDYCLVTEELMVGALRSIKISGSDHRGLVANISWAPSLN